MAAVWLAPAPGDLVWCWFPHLPEPAPDPKPRPALEVSVLRREDGISVQVV